MFTLFAILRRSRAELEVDERIATATEAVAVALQAILAKLNEPSPVPPEDLAAITDALRAHDAPAQAALDAVQSP